MAKTAAPAEEVEVDKAQIREDLKAKIVEMREAGSKWEEICESIPVSTGRAMYLYLEATVSPKDRIKFKTDEERDEKIVKARDEDLLSWAQISTRSGIAESRCRKIYEDATGQSTKGNRIGRGGRYPDGAEVPARASAPKENAVKKAAATKAAAKKAPAAAAKKAPAAKAPAKSKNPLHTADYEGLIDLVEGKVLSFKVGGKAKKAEITSIDDLVDGNVTFTTVGEEEITIPVTGMIKVLA